MKRMKGEKREGKKGRKKGEKEKVKKKSIGVNS